MIQPLSKERYILKQIIKSIHHVIEDNTLQGKDSTQLHKLLKRCEQIEENYYKLDDEVYRLEYELEKGDYDNKI